MLLSSHLLEGVMATLFEEDRLCIDGCHHEQVVAVGIYIPFISPSIVIMHVGHICLGNSLYCTRMSFIWAHVCLLPTLISTLCLVLITKAILKCIIVLVLVKLCLLTN